MKQSIHQARWFSPRHGRSEGKRAVVSRFSPMGTCPPRLALDATDATDATDDGSLTLRARLVPPSLPRVHVAIAGATAELLQRVKAVRGEALVLVLVR